MTLDDHILLDTVTTIVITMLASSGFWALIQWKLSNNKTIDEQRKLQLDLLRGLAHDRIVYLGLKYLSRGKITHDEYENLCTYLYTPYKAMGGNGSADRIMTEINRLPVVSSLNINDRYINKGDSTNV